MRSNGGDVSGVHDGISFHTLVLPLAADASACRALESRFEAGFQIYRAVLREGLRRLDLLRQSKTWRSARALPAATQPQARVRNRALNTARTAHGLGGNDLTAWARQTRTKSEWLADHIDAATAEQLAARAWKALAGHLVDGKGRPRLPRREEFSSLDGVARNATSRAWQSITLRGRFHPNPAAGPLPVRGVEKWTGPLTVVWNAKRGTSRILAVPVRTHRLSPACSHARLREEHALTRPDAWRTARIVRRRTVVGHDVRWVYELHLGVELPAWTPPDRYPAPAAARDAGRRVGVDLGVSSVAVVGVDTIGVTGALLVTASPSDRTTARDARLVARRRARALERSRRSSNPHAYGPDKRGRLGRGSRKPGSRLSVSNNYRKLRAQQADAARRAASERHRRIDKLAIDVVATFGPNLLIEKTSTRAWMRLWGTSIGRFAPSTLRAALAREASRAGGKLAPIDTWSTALSQHCICGVRAKKTLSQRTHTCGCTHLDGRPVHRDLMSAFLHTAVIPTTSPAQAEDRFDPLLAAILWDGRPGAGECLRAAGTNPNRIHRTDADSTWTNPGSPVSSIGGRATRRAGRRHAHAPANPCDDVATPSGEGAGKTGPAMSKNPPRTTVPGLPLGKPGNHRR